MTNNTSSEKCTSSQNLPESCGDANTQRKFLTALEGRALYVGDTIHSNFHRKEVVVGGMYIDQDGDVYLNYPEGQAHIENCQWPHQKTKGLTHVDDFVSYSYGKEEYARWFIFLARLTAALKIDWQEYIGQYKLFCTYEGKRYRVTGASRIGDVWLAKDFNRETGYDLRVDLAGCTEWGDTE